MFDASQAELVVGDAADDTHLVDDDAGFFAPVSFDALDALLSAYQTHRARIDVVAEFVKGPEAQSVIHYFLEGNRSDDRGRTSLELSAAQLFSPEGAIGALNAAYWSKALQLTDVLDMMPQARRTEWHEQMRSPLGTKKDYHAIARDRAEHPEWFDENREYLDPAKAYTRPRLPDFEPGTVRDTLASLVAMRAQFFGERVDGIFRALSGTHVTNQPEGFSKRMILAHVNDFRQEGVINDLRCIVAKFMGREEPKYNVTSNLLRRLRGRWGELHEIDGGALRMRIYKIGTAHLEVHPDMAWRLNQILAHLYPAAIPSEFRQRPKRKAKNVTVMKRPLSFAVLSALEEVKQAKEKTGQGWRGDTYRDIPRTRAFYGAGVDKHVADEVRAVLAAIGGSPREGSTIFWEFDYEPAEVLQEILISGCIPDAKSYQFYPTPERLARLVVELAGEGAGEDAQWLEPSAGMGGLAEFMPKDRTVCVERAEMHCKVLQGRGFNAICADFLEWSEGRGLAGSFDRVAMNPPFDRGQWRAHLDHAAALVRPGGRLVAILPSGARGSELRGFNTTWQGPYSKEFPGTTVEVVILVADRQP